MGKTIITDTGTHMELLTFNYLHIYYFTDNKNYQLNARYFAHLVLNNDDNSPVTVGDPRPLGGVWSQPSIPTGKRAVVCYRHDNI